MKISIRRIIASKTRRDGVYRVDKKRKKIGHKRYRWVYRTLTRYICHRHRERLRNLCNTKSIMTHLSFFHSHWRAASSSNGQEVSARQINNNARTSQNRRVDRSTKVAISPLFSTFDRLFIYTHKLDKLFDLL